MRKGDLEVLEIGWQMEVDRRKEAEEELRHLCAAANRLLDALNEFGNDASAIYEYTQALGDALHAIGEPDDRGEVSIHCPRCGLRSYHPEDIRNRYCARCGSHDGLLRKGEGDAT